MPVLEDCFRHFRCLETTAIRLRDVPSQLSYFDAKRRLENSLSELHICALNVQAIVWNRVSEFSVSSNGKFAWLTTPTILTLFNAYRYRCPRIVHILGEHYIWPCFLLKICKFRGLTDGIWPVPHKEQGIPLKESNLGANPKRTGDRPA